MIKINKLKLYLILTIMVGFTLVNVINDNNWVGYLLSLVVIPLITWGIIELFLKYRNHKIMDRQPIIFIGIMGLFVVLFRVATFRKSEYERWFDIVSGALVWVNLAVIGWCVLNILNVL